MGLGKPILQLYAIVPRHRALAPTIRPIILSPDQAAIMHSSQLAAHGRK